MNKQDKRAAQEKAEAELRRMTRNLASLDRNGDIKHTQTELTKHVIDGDRLYPTIKKQLSGSTADAGFVKTLLRVSRATAKRINNTAKSFTLSEKTNKLRRTLQPSECARFINNKYAAEFICIPPTFEYFYGAIRQDGLVIGQRKKRARMQLDDPALKLVKATEKNIHTDCEQDSTPKEVEAIHEKIKHLTRNRPSGVRFISAIVDPQSYSHTVENLFHTAFLVKEGKVCLKKGNGTAPMITLTEDDTKPKDQVCKQSILSFSMDDYKAWVTALNN